jgi:hypothetical protein
LRRGIVGNVWTRAAEKGSDERDDGSHDDCTNDFGRMGVCVCVCVLCVVVDGIEEWIVS